MAVDLGAVVTRLQSHYIRGAPPRQVIDTLLPELLALTGSAFGFIAEVWRDAGGVPYLKLFTHTDIAWDEATRHHVEQHREAGLEFHNLDSLLGAAVLTQQPVIANDPANDPRRAGLPPGHPPLHAYLGVPLLQGGVMVGVVGLANRSGGYDEALVQWLQPLFGTVGFILGQLQADRERAQLDDARVAAQASDRANRAKTEFLSRMSHELRTPLNAVLGFAQLLRMNQRDPLTPGQGEQVRHIERAGQHLLAMINDVLDLSRIEEGALALQLAPLPVAGAVQEALVLLQTAASDAEVTLVLQGGPPLRVRADAQRLRQVLVNLLSNAVKYNRRGGRVIVSWSADSAGGAAGCRIDVLDTGIGLDEAQRAHLFEPFNRLGAERGKVEGAGIGLVITQRLLHLMQGDLRVQSRPGLGSCFSVLLPAAPAGPAAAEAGVDGNDPPDPVTDAVVLYVEDNRLNQELLRQVLRLRPALQLLCAPSGERALAMARDLQPQLLLIDWHLGDMDGAQVLQRLRALPGLSACPAVVLSADATRERQEAALRAGFDAYLTKPFGVADLLSCLDRLVGPPPSSGFMALR
jgi:signal transduction histidine kinase/CheY-like chemotaxis protein